MERREIVRRAIEFENPPRLPFFIGSFWKDRLQQDISDFPNDVCDCWEMDRHESGWFFDNAVTDDWGCKWASSEVENMGQVYGHPLEDWSALDTYRPPNPGNPFYFSRIEDTIKDAGDRYVVLTSHFNLIERLHMLRGFSNTLEDFYFEPEKIHRVLDMILEYKISHINEAARRFGNRVHGLFLTDDWGTQQNTMVSPEIFQEFFAERYRTLFDSIHGHGWHVLFHSCGKVNNFVPYFIDLGADVLNLQQPRLYGIEELGRQFAGKVCFLTTVDIQATLPSRDPVAVREEAEELIKHWSTPQGGFVVFNYGDSIGIGTSDEISRVMFTSFYDLRTYWQENER